MSKKTRCKDLESLVRLGHIIERELAGRSRLADAPASQAALAAVLELDRGIKGLKALRDEIVDGLIEHLQAGKCPEHGALVASLQVSEKRSVAWKDHAIDQAGKLARALGRKFDPAKWIAGIMKRTPKSKSYGVKIEVNNERDA